MGKWTRRAFISTGLLVGGGFAVGVALRPGNRQGELAKFVTDHDETLLHTWVKVDKDNVITAIVPHSEMGQGAGTALTQMLADELDADWNLVRFEEAPAIDEFANHPITKGALATGDGPPGDRRSYRGWRLHSRRPGARSPDYGRKHEHPQHGRLRHARRGGRRPGNADRSGRRGLGRPDRPGRRP